MQNYTFRPKSRQDLFDSIEETLTAQHIKAGCVLSSVGSLARAALRLANREILSEYNGYFKIVSITGTVSIFGSQFHISISDGGVNTIGRHLAGGCRIYTPAENVIAGFRNIDCIHTYI